MNNESNCTILWQIFCLNSSIKITSTASFSFAHLSEKSLNSIMLFSGTWIFTNCLIPKSYVLKILSNLSFISSRLRIRPDISSNHCFGNGTGIYEKKFSHGSLISYQSYFQNILMKAILATAEPCRMICWIHFIRHTPSHSHLI